MHDVTARHDTSCYCHVTPAGREVRFSPRPGWIMYSFNLIVEPIMAEV